MPQEEKESLLNCLKSIKDIYIPNYEPFSIPQDGLIVYKDINKNEIYFENDIIYNTETKILKIPTKEEIFEGNLYKNSWNKYFLDNGEYKWNSGQKYIGQFNDKNKFDGDSRLISENNWRYNGIFKNGKPNGYGELKWDNGDYIKGNFKNGKIHGITNINKNGINFDTNYTNSLINDSINNIKLSIGNKKYNISNITINKGKIKDDYLIINEDNNNEKVKIKLTDKNKGLLSEIDYKEFDFNENDLIILFKYLNKVRKFNLCDFSSLSIPEDGLILNDKIIKNMNENNVKLTLQNNETFKGKIKKEFEKYWLVEGEYEWLSGQKYTGKFKKNKFESENAELKLKNEWKYKGEFKNGYIDGKGIYENKNGDKIEGYFEKGEL